MRMRLQVVVRVAFLATIGCLGAAGTAEAGEFAISACAADRGRYSTQAFEDFATRGMMWKRACNPQGPGLRGLVTSNVPRRGRVPRGARTYFILRTPEGTRFKSLSWAGEARRRDCRYALQLWADRPDGPPASIKNVRANRRCPNHDRAQIAGWGRSRTYPIAGTTRIVQRVICVGAHKEPYCSARGLNYIRTFSAAATVEDVSAPTVSIVPDNPFTRGEWVRGLQSVTYDAADNVGIRHGRAVVGGVGAGSDVRACDYSRRIPCASGPGQIAVETRFLPEGSQPLTSQAEDPAGNLGNSGATTVRIDNTAPGAVQPALAGGDGWRNQNDFDLSWVNPSEGDRAPIAAAHYRVCRAGTPECTSSSSAAPGIARLDNVAVPGPGEWQVRLWRQDAAGNQEPANASLPVTLRFDPEPPQLGFEEQSSADPTVISALVTDKVSGLSGGAIEISREGSETWQALETQQQGSRLVARVDDARVPPGNYLVRATARDHATNVGMTDRRLDGRPMVLALPLRSATAMRAGVQTKRTVRRTVRRGRKRREVRRQLVRLEPRAHLAFGSRTHIVGQLMTGDGQPLPGAAVRVFTQTATSGEQFLGTVTTDTGGRYRYVAQANASRTLRFVYPGSAHLLPSEREVSVVVAASSSIRAQPRRLRNGQAVTFTGRLRSLPLPPAGKLVELQVVLSGRWQTFRTTLTDAAGAWRVRYRFRRSCGVLGYRFRARLPAEAGYTFETGRTRPISVRVRGAPCR
jgi:hypothetical protein